MGISSQVVSPVTRKEIQIGEKTAGQSSAAVFLCNCIGDLIITEPPHMFLPLPQL